MNQHQPPYQDQNQNQHQASSSFTYRPAIDGLRTVSVAAVFAYHLNFNWATGGFLGVDVFFVLSGYLITSLMLNEWRQFGSINVLAFWARRARRLFPAIFALLISIAIYATWFASADQIEDLRGSMFATMLYVQNWWLIAEELSYFDLYSAPSPLRHAWSLAIEEQYYLIWPLLFVVAIRFGGHLNLLRNLLLLCITGIVASVLCMAFVFDPADPSRAYYGTDTRAHTLLTGAILAGKWFLHVVIIAFVYQLVTPVATPIDMATRTHAILGGVILAIWSSHHSYEFMRPSFLKDRGLLKFVCIGFLLFCLASLGSDTLKITQWRISLIAILSLILVYIASYNGNYIIPKNKVLSAMLIWAGSRSYAIYLTHIPSFKFTQELCLRWLEADPGFQAYHHTAALWLGLSLVLVLSELNYRLIEQPFRNRGVKAAESILKRSVKEADPKLKDSP